MRARMNTMAVGSAPWALLWLLAAAGLLSGGVAAAADVGDTSRFDPLQTFAPFDYQHPVNRYRSSNGTPGPDYWQNRVDYHIKARLHPQSHSLSGSVVIDYSNNSPDALHMLWLQLDQNRYRTDARGNFIRDRMPAAGDHTKGYELRSVELRVDGEYRPVHYQVSDTRMRVDLPEPLPPQSGSLRLRIQYVYTIPGDFGGRTGWFQSNNGAVYEIAQWFPRMSVYDDLRGWNTLPYLKNEFYLEYGDIDYRITVPAGMLVSGSGKLMNPQEVLTDTQRQRLDKARHSDATVMIRTPEEVTAAATRPLPDGTETWHFHMHNTRDVAFAASRAFVWDAARINLPSGRTAMAMSLYPVESLGEGSHWQTSTQYVKHTVEFYSQKWFEYPWVNAITVGGKVGGMEYPGIAFDWWELPDEAVFMLATHEVGHNWFPMIVGFNERRHAWMDEGFNTFGNVLATADYADGKFAPKRDSEFAPGGGNPVVEILPLLADPAAPPILTRADAIDETYRHPVSYFKTALGLLLLRNVILGPERFHTAFRRFVQAWAFKHPAPSDFFRAMDSAAGANLAWFWRGWFAHNWQFDMAITGVEPVDDEAGRGIAVTIANLDRMVFPTTLQVTWADGHHTRKRIPVATWLGHRQFTVRIPGEGTAVSATLDPEHVLPDAQRDNNAISLN